MADDVPYMLSRGVHSSLRLNFQHYFLKDATGFLIHPSIPIDRDGALNIADIGTGTAIWLMDVSRDFPHFAGLDGFDISDAQWPTKKNRPANVNLHVMDCVHEEMPSKFHGCYDIVHVRLLLGSVNNNDPSLLFKNAWKLLKPGGYLQWTEIDPHRTEVKNPTGGSTEATEFIIKMATSVKDMRWLQRLADLFIDAGMDPVKQDFCRNQAWQRRAGSDAFVAMGFDLVAVLYGSDPAKSKEYDETMSRAAKEVQDGTYLNQAITTVVGRVPKARQT